MKVFHPKDSKCSVSLLSTSSSSQAMKQSKECKIKKRERLCNFFVISYLVIYFKKKQKWLVISCLFMTLKMGKVKQESQSPRNWKGLTHVDNYTVCPRNFYKASKQANLAIVLNSVFDFPCKMN